MNPNDPKALRREILLGPWKIHILHHAEDSPLVGQWMLRELRRHAGVSDNRGRPETGGAFCGGIARLHRAGRRKGAYWVLMLS